MYYKNASVYFSTVNTHSKRVHDYSRRVRPASCGACDSKTASEAEKEYIMKAMKGVKLISPNTFITDAIELGISVTYYEASKICGDC
jgi:hypothetical protein